MAEQTNTYELTYILNAVLSEAQLKDLVQDITRLITDNGGEIIAMEEWGTRRLTYTIDKKRNGYYVNVHFRAPAGFIVRLERSLEINESVLRYLTLRYDSKMLRHFEQRKDRAALKAGGVEDEQTSTPEAATEESETETEAEVETEE